MMSLISEGSRLQSNYTGHVADQIYLPIIDSMSKYYPIELIILFLDMKQQ